MVLAYNNVLNVQCDVYFRLLSGRNSQAAPDVVSNTNTELMEVSLVILSYCLTYLSAQYFSTDTRSFVINCLSYSVTKTSL